MLDTTRRDIRIACLFLSTLTASSSHAAFENILEMTLDSAGRGVNYSIFDHTSQSSTYIAFQASGEYNYLERSTTTQSKGKFASVGIGWRQQLSPTWVLGGYCFYDRNFPSDERESDFFQLNPGIEFISPVWHGTLNFHIPRTLKGLHMPHSNGFKLFSGHNQINRYYLDEIFSSDIKIAYRFLPSLSAFAGAYYFHPQGTKTQEGYRQAILGGVGGLNYSLGEAIHLSIQAAYDAIHQTRIMLGIKFRLGISHAEKATSLHSLWNHALSRHLVPVMQARSNQVINDSIYFFAKASPWMSKAATAEDPSTCLDQMTIDDLPNNAKIYLSGDSYHTIYSSFQRYADLTLKPGQSLFGCINRQWGELQGRPVLPIKQLILPGFNQVGNFTMDYPDGNSILVKNADQCSIQGVRINKVQENLSGIKITESKNVDIQDIRINYKKKYYTRKTPGIEIEDSTDIIVKTVDIHGADPAINVNNSQNCQIENSNLKYSFSESSLGFGNRKHFTLVEVGSKSSIYLINNTLSLSAEDSRINIDPILLSSVWSKDNSSQIFLTDNNITLETNSLLYQVYPVFPFHDSPSIFSLRNNTISLYGPKDEYLNNSFSIRVQNNATTQVIYSLNADLQQAKLNRKRHEEMRKKEEERNARARKNERERREREERYRQYQEELFRQEQERLRQEREAKARYQEELFRQEQERLRQEREAKARYQEYLKEQEAVRAAQQKTDNFEKRKTEEFDELFKKDLQDHARPHLKNETPQERKARYQEELAEYLAAAREEVKEQKKQEEKILRERRKWEELNNTKRESTAPSQHTTQPDWNNMGFPNNKLASYEVLKQLSRTYLTEKNFTEKEKTEGITLQNILSGLLNSTLQPTDPNFKKMSRVLNLRLHPDKNKGLANPAQANEDYKKLQASLDYFRS